MEAPPAPGEPHVDAPRLRRSPRGVHAGAQGAGGRDGRAGRLRRRRRPADCRSRRATTRRRTGTSPSPPTTSRPPRPWPPSSVRRCWSAPSTPRGCAWPSSAIRREPRSSRASSSPRTPPPADPSTARSAARPRSRPPCASGCPRRRHDRRRRWATRSAPCSPRSSNRSRWPAPPPESPCPEDLLHGTGPSPARRRPCRGSGSSASADPGRPGPARTDGSGDRRGDRTQLGLGEELLERRGRASSGCGSLGLVVTGRSDSITWSRLVPRCGPCAPPSPS